jgi:hypothetical protein
MAGSRLNATGMWVSLMDYAMRKEVSLSTLRRHIKANKLKYKVEEGRYLLWVEEEVTQEEPAPVQANPSHPKEDSALLQNRLQKLTVDLQRAREEIAELKTLIALYEENIPPQSINS